MELDYKAIGKRIKIARIQVDLTQEKLAEYVNRIVKDLLSTIIYTLRRDLSLKKHRHAQDDFTK